MIFPRTALQRSKDRRFGEILSKAQFRSDFLKEGNTSTDVHETVVNYSHPFWRFDRNAAWRTVPINFQLGFEGDQKRPFCINKSGLGNIGGLLGGCGGFFSGLDGGFHIHGLFVGSGPQSSRLDEEAGSFDSQHNCKYRNDCVSQFEFEEVSDTSS